MDKFTYVAFKGTPYEHSYRNCVFKTGRYQNGNLALAIENQDGEIATCTVNPGEEISPIAICVKTYSENAGMDKFLSEIGIVHPEPNCYKQCGWSSVPVMILTKKGLALFRDDKTND